MATPALKLIARLVTQHRNEVSCLTAGAHAAARTLVQAAGIAIIEVENVRSGIADLCREKGWDFRALARRIPASDERCAQA